MSEDANAGSAGAGGQRSSATGSSPTIFVCDPSVEGARIADVLRAAGYVVADVPLTQLATRAGVQKPSVVLLDVDPSGALDEVSRLRRVAGTGAIDFVYLGAGDGLVKDADDALSHQASAFFRRPVDIAGLVRKVDALTGGTTNRAQARASTPPPSIPVSRAHLQPPASREQPSRAPSTRDPSPPPSDRPSTHSLPSPGLRTPGPPLPLSAPSLSDLVEAPRSLASFGGVSKELEQLLADAEMRVEASTGEIPIPTPEEEIEAVLPADVLALLDDPLDADDDEDAALEVGVRPGGGAGTNVEGLGRPTTAGGSRSPSTGGGVTPRKPSTDNPPRSTGTRPNPSSLAPPPSASFGTHPAVSTSAQSAVTPPPRIPSLPSRVSPVSQSAPPPWATPPSPAATTSTSTSTASSSVAPDRGPSVKPPATGSVAVDADGVRRFVGDAIARRLTGALAFDHDRVVRRIVLRDGDLVTAASSDDDECFVAFLAARGELTRDEAAKLVSKVAPYGRHAGAALVAHGLVSQDQLWPSLRAHAEWIATIVLRLPGATATLEADPPGRLRSEPSVFGASTGPSIFVELVRRAVGGEEALLLLGGPKARIGDGPNGGLLAECGLPANEIDLLARVRGGTVSDLLARATDPEITSTLHALALLGIVDLAPALDGGRRSPDVSEPEIAALDEEAVRLRVRARLELVEEGDYFAVLGVARDATGYDVRRAYLELRRAFEPSRILSPRIADLADDVKRIVVVLDEAYEILRDPARRERYRRAIDARP